MATAPTSRLDRTGRFVFRHHRWFAVAWLVVLTGAGYLSTADHSATSNSFSVPGADSQQAYDLLGRRFSSQNAATATVVLHADRGTTLADHADQIAQLVAAVERSPGVASAANPLTTDFSELLQAVSGQLPSTVWSAVSSFASSLPPTVSADGRTAVVNVTLDRPVSELLDAYPPSADSAAEDYVNPYSRLVQAVAASTPQGVHAYVGGAVADTWNQPVSWWASHSDEVGLAIGAVLLLLAFGSLFGMVVPIVSALFGAVTAGGLVYLLATQVDVSAAAPAVTLMISIGVGLDYGLLVVTRYRELVGKGVRAEEAAGYALSTAGRSALFAGVTVCIAMLGLLIVPIPLVQTLGVSAAIGVATMMVTTVTLLMALLGFTGRRIDRVSVHHAGQEGTNLEQSFWGRFATRMSSHPVAALVGGTVVLLLLAVPFLRIEFGMPTDGSLPAGLSQRNAFNLVDSAFGPGTNGPLVVVVGLPKSVPYAQAVELVAPVSTSLGALRPSGTVPGVKYSLGPVPNDASATSAVIYQIVPTSGPNDAATTQLVRDLRQRLSVATKGTGLQAHVGGATATLIDLTDLVTRYLPWVIGGVVLGAFLLLVLVFRSVLVPLKAAVMNLVSIAAAYGVVVMVFQLGWAKGLVGISQTIPIVSFVPLVMFVILFGLSMDYEVFLMSRVKEEWDRTGDATASVVRGVAGTARVITTAALIMLAVFLSFVANANPTVKLIGFGMAVAVLLDSTVVRMVLVPAVMELLGRRAWWFPSWLGWLPTLDVEGNTDEPAPFHGSPSAAARATDLRPLPHLSAPDGDGC